MTTHNGEMATFRRSVNESFLSSEYVNELCIIERESMQNASAIPLPREAAEMLALEALGWLAAEPDRIGTFLGVAGAAPEELRSRAGEPEFLGFVLDFLLSDEDMLLAFCGDCNFAPDRPMRARAALPGGDLPNWT